MIKFTFVFALVVIARMKDTLMVRAARNVDTLLYHTCVLLNNNRVKCFGYNNLGQLGQGHTNAIGDEPYEMGTNLSAIDLGTNRHAKAISVGSDFTCVLCDDDAVRCFGANFVGQLGQGHTEDIGNDLFEMGDNLSVTDFGSARYATIIDSGMYHTCVVLNDGAVKCFGLNSDGQLGLGHDRTIGDDPYEMGDNLSTVDLGTNRYAKNIAVGSYFTCVLLDNDLMKCFGGNADGQLGRGNQNTIGNEEGEMGDNLSTIDLGTGKTVKAIAAGNFHTCAILNDNSLKCFGKNLYGQLGQGNTNSIGDHAFELGDNLSAIDLGANRYAIALSIGFQTCVILDNRSVKCFGNNDYGQLGRGNVENIGDGANEMGENLPTVDLGTNRTAKIISVSHFYSCVLLLEDDTVKCFGLNDDGPLGQGTSEYLGDDPNEMGDFLPPIDLGEPNTRSPSRNPSRNPSKNPTRPPSRNPSRNPTSTPSRNPTVRSPTRSPTPVADATTNCRLVTGAQACFMTAGCRFVFSTSGEFKKLKATFISKCTARGDFGCRAQNDCGFKCGKLRKLDRVCRNFFG